MATTHKFATIFGSAVCALSLAAAQPAQAADDKDIKLSGCLVQAQDGDGYIVTNSPNEPAMVGTSGRVATDAFGGTGNFSTVLYWLDDDNNLKPHVGHRVEIEGDLKGDIKDGELKVDRKDKWTELELKSDGRTLKANVPNTSFVARDGDNEQKGRVMVRRVSVEKVKMLGASCTE